MGWIDDLSTAWEREYPDLDTSTFPPMVRLARLSVLIEGFQQAVLSPFELSSGDYGVLAALRRQHVSAASVAGPERPNAAQGRGSR